MKLYTIDAFSAKPFGGNPAAVCPSLKPLPEATLQKLASEMNLSETAYVWPEPDGKLRLRWFTPGGEVKLCGHATVATAAALYRYGGAGLAAGQTHFDFETLSGTLSASRLVDGRWQLDFPRRAVWAAASPPANLADVLGCTPLWVGETDQDGFVELATTDLRVLKPDFGRMKAWQWRGIIVTAASDVPEYHCLSRFFVPKLGIDEDPVTGSAHCAVAPFWAERLQRTTLSAYQASPRGGELALNIVGDRVQMAGHATYMLEAELVADIG